jgi:hypothetical protein
VIGVVVVDDDDAKRPMLLIVRNVGRRCCGSDRSTIQSTKTQSPMMRLTKNDDGTTQIPMQRIQNRRRMQRRDVT